MSSFDRKISENFDNYNFPNEVGAVEIVDCYLGNGNSRINILPQVKSITINESIFDNYFIQGTIVIEDAIGYAEILPIIGDEWLFLNFTTPTSGIENKRLYKIISSSPEQYDGENPLVTYSLKFVTYEYFLNLKEKVFIARNSITIHNLAQKIYKNYITKFLDSNGEPIGTVDIPLNQIFIPEKVKGVYNICISNKTPFNAIHYLSARALSNNYNGASFIFYQDNHRFNFTSLEYLIETPYVLRYTQQPAGLSDAPARERISAAYKTIQSYEIKSKFDVLKSLNNGMYSSRMLSLDLARLEVLQRDFYYELPKDKNAAQFFINANPGSNYRQHVERVTPSEEYFDADLWRSTYNSQINLDKQTSFADYLRGIFDDAVKGKRADWIQENLNSTALQSRFKHLNNRPLHNIQSDVLYAAQAKYFFNNTTEGYNLPIGKSEYSSRGEHPNNIESIFQQRISQLMQFNTVVLNIDVFGHTGRTVGQVINVILPTRISDEYNTSIQAKRNNIFSGNYLVTKVTHLLNRESGGGRFNHNMSLELRTDSINLHGDSAGNQIDIDTYGEPGRDSGTTPEGELIVGNTGTLGGGV